MRGDPLTDCQTFQCLHDYPFLKSLSGLAYKCFCSLSHPQPSHASVKSQSLAQDRRSITLVQITGPHQKQHHLPVMMLCITRALSSMASILQCEERVPLQRPAQKAGQDNNTGVWQTCCKPSVDPF